MCEFKYATKVLSMLAKSNKMVASKQAIIMPIYGEKAITMVTIMM